MRSRRRPHRSRARALAQLGNTWLSNYEQAETFFRRSLAITTEYRERLANDRRPGTPLGGADARRCRNGACDGPRCRFSHASIRRPRRALAQALLVLGHTLESTGRFAEALAPLDESIVLSEQIGDIAGVAWARRIQGLALLALDRAVQSEAQFRTAMTEFEQVGEHVMIGFCQLDLARMVLHTHQTAQTAALDLIAQAIEVVPCRWPMCSWPRPCSILARDFSCTWTIQQGAVALLCAAKRCAHHHRNSLFGRDAT